VIAESSIIQSMSPGLSIFTPLERAVLASIGDMHSSDQSALDAQLSTAVFDRRENTGCGFFTYFAVDQSSTPPISGSRLRDGPYAQVEGVEHGFGFILWLKEGYANCLEGYNWGSGVTIGLDLGAVNFKLAAGPDDLAPNKFN
jgi:hypothetical protein